MSNYAHPEVLVSTDWVADHLDDPDVALVEVDVNTYVYDDEGYIPGAVAWSWKSQLSDPVQRDIIPKEDLEALLSASGITGDTTIVLYGDNNNWFATWAFWELKIYGHEDVRLMDGGRKKWIQEDRALTSEEPEVEPTEYTAQDPDYSLRAFLPEVREETDRGTVELVDVRSPAEFSGEILAP